MTHIEEFSFKDSAQLDAFGRLRVSNPTTIFDSKQIHDNQPLFWDETTGLEDITSAHSTDTASTVITYTGGAIGGTFTRQTFMRFNYQPGKSQQIMMTGILQRSGGDGFAIQRSIGLFDDDNGFFFTDDADDIQVVRRTKVTGSVVDNTVAQASWNVDVMNGGGPSGLVVDWSKVQIFVIDFQWLGSGRIRMGLSIGGVVHIVHEFLTSNVLDKVHISTPNLPLRYQMVVGAELEEAPATTMEAICATVISEGGVDDLGVLRYKSTAGTHVDAATENLIYALVGIRLKTTHLDATIDIVNITVTEHVGSKEFEWILFLNPTVAGTFTFGNETNSAVQTATGATANTISGGTAIAGGHGSSARQGGASTQEAIHSAIRLGATIAGVADRMVLCVRPIGGSTNIDVEGSLTWREVP